MYIVDPEVASKLLGTGRLSALETMDARDFSRANELTADQIQQNIDTLSRCSCLGCEIMVGMWREHLTTRQAEGEADAAD